VITRVLSWVFSRIKQVWILKCRSLVFNRGSMLLTRRIVCLLSQRITNGLLIIRLIASKMRTIAINSEAVSDKASNSASIDDIVRVGCFNTF